MESEHKVFASSIIRTQVNLKNNLHEILKVNPAVPLQIDSAENSRKECNFVPSNDKYYVPKKKLGKKVKTVRDIRCELESDVNCFLPDDLEKQKKFLLRKIRSGNAKDENTKDVAKKMLNAHNPISKSAWQMIMNINPEGNNHPYQYILLNGNCIQVNGSKGGKRKFIYKYNVGKVKEACFNRSTIKTDLLNRKKTLLQHSLNVKFKPGPLSKKKDLDYSYQKYQFGDMEVIQLPKPGLEIQPSYGKPLSPFIHNTFLLNCSEIINPKWADFSLSMLGTIKNGIPVQSTEENIIFNLDYTSSQHKIIMRHDSDKINPIDNSESTNYEFRKEDNSTVESVVYNVVNEILNSVEISIKQNNMYTGEDEPRNSESDRNLNANKSNQLKDKPKRKFGELGRLDVTVITIAENIETIKNDVVCHNEYCRLGCICDALKCSYSLRRHCGRVECMFKCTCDFSGYRLSDSIDDDCSDIIPGLINLDKKLGATLAKEEHKFHQTVIVKNEKSIFIKPERRNWKASKKYADFYSNMQLKSDNYKRLLTLSIVCEKLNLKNVEPLCMVHNLYKCFCKGKFTQSVYTKPVGAEEVAETANNVEMSINASNEKLSTESLISKNLKRTLPPRRSFDVSTLSLNDLGSESRIYGKSKQKSISDSSELELLSNDLECSRILPYQGRKYSDEYYHRINAKVGEMEISDTKLHDKMMEHVNREQSSRSDTLQKELPSVDKTSSLRELLTNVIEHKQELEKAKSVDSDAKLDVTRLPKKATLVSWLEASYKQYKQRADRGESKIILDPPKHGKIALYPWEFILSRYRDRSNFFLISKQTPFRIYLAVDIKNPFFRNCINISDILQSELYKYPATIKHLLTNTTETKDSFCILCGLSFCWELIGSVSKLNESKKEVQSSNKQISFEDKSESDSVTDFENISVLTEPFDMSNNWLEEHNQSERRIEQSKWFIMAVENDFREIRFYQKGFFVKYESVVKAVSVAKSMGKTVRLSSQKCCGNEHGPLFGIYAIPNTKDMCVIIGPYEKDEELGIEIMKCKPDLTKVRYSRGTWLITNKIDNLKVIDNPMLFLPSDNIDFDKMQTIDNCNSGTTNEIKSNNKILIKSNLQEIISEQTKTTVPKAVKPITIRKSNGFYQLSSNGLLRRKPLNKSLLLSNTSKITKSNNNVFKPVAEIAPQVKEGSSTFEPFQKKRKLECGMSILKPEEINKRSYENKLSSNPQPQTNYNIRNDKEVDMDIEKFLATSVVYATPFNNDVFVISDDEDDSGEYTKENTETSVWIVPRNIENLGWIPSRRNAENNLSFEFPGFKFTEYYVEEEAFNKINQVLARKVYVPSHINIEWQVVESLDDVKMEKLKTDCLNADYILTKNGLLHKLQVKGILKSENNAELVNTGDSSHKEIIANVFEETSQTLEEENLFLWRKTVEKKSELLRSIAEASEERRLELTDQLAHIQSSAEDNL